MAVAMPIIAGSALIGLSQAEAALTDKGARRTGRWPMACANSASDRWAASNWARP
jgi:hypothetical protein